jgi:hypothetical protein
MLNTRSYTALIISGIEDNWCRMMQRRTFAYQDLCIPIRKTMSLAKSSLYKWGKKWDRVTNYTYSLLD